MRQQAENFVADFWRIVLGVKRECGLLARHVERRDAIQERILKDVLDEERQLLVENLWSGYERGANHEVIRNTFSSNDDLLSLVEERQIASFVDEVVHPRRSLLGLEHHLKTKGTARTLCLCSNAEQN